MKKNFKLSIYNAEIPRNEEPKFLSIKFDRSLTFKAHNLDIEKKIIKRMSLMKNLTNDPLWKLDSYTLIKIYKTLARSVIDFAFMTSIAMTKS